LVALLAAAGAGTVVAQALPGVEAAVAVAPLDDQAVALPSQGDRHERLGTRPGHGAPLLQGTEDRFPSRIVGVPGGKGTPTPFGGPLAAPLGSVTNRLLR